MKPNRPLAARLLVPAALTAAIVGGTTACDSDTSSEGTSTSVRTLTPEQPASPSVASPSASATPQTQESLEASVSAELERVRAEATELLEGADGRGNAVQDVSVTGQPVSASETFRSALVRVTNSTDQEAFYAVRVEFVDANGDVLDSAVVGFEDAPPGRTVSKQATSRKAAGVKTFPRVAQAERG
ncbi:hypothetical protein OG230_02010 [Streptomyces sp. NBC_00234]|uniref:hypothetical protein n=1 Tax=Streptomyces sp. NBC_00234 TaxID=2903638 RepID=UPI002E2A5A34|nr:hypothetical protein [Streptomyces sp. NBC_00234]